MSGPRRILVALPALDEEEQLGGVLKQVPSRLPGAEITTLVVDDGSRDRTAEVAAQHGARVIRHPTNRGVGAAFHTTVEEALRCGADLLVTIDADGQFDPAEIPGLVRPLLEGRADFAIGTRFSDGRTPEDMPRLKLWGNRFFASLVRRLTGLSLSDVSCGFRAYSREALLHLNLFGRFTYTQETILDLAFKDLRIVEVPVTVRYLPGRRSRVAGSLVRYGLNALQIITRTARDFRPMYFFGVIGVGLFLLGVALDLWLFWHYFRVGTFTPYKFVGVIGGSLNLAGILTFGIALLADMLDRMRVNQERILYFLRRSAHGEGSGGATDVGRGADDRDAR